MSIAWLSKCWPLQTGSTTKKAVLLVLADHADEDGFCWPRVATICVRTELQDRAVRKAIRELEDDGYINVQEDYEPAGRQTSNVYRLTINVKSPPVSGAGGRVHHVQGAPAPDAPPTRTVSRTVSKNRENAGSSRPRRITESDDPTSDAGDAPAPGQQPRKTTAERNSAADAKGTSAHALARRLRTQLEDEDFLAPVNVTAVAGQIRAWNLDPAVVRQMIDLFTANPRHYLKGDEVPWVGFLRQRQALKKDATKMADAADPAAKFRAG